MINHVEELYRQITDGGSVLDVGCIGFRQVDLSHKLGRHQLIHHGVDYVDPSSEVPKGFIFKKVDLNVEPIPFKCEVS